MDAFEILHARSLTLNVGKKKTKKRKKRKRVISKANHGIALIDFSVWKPQHFIKLSQAV